MYMHFSSFCLRPERCVAGISRIDKGKVDGGAVLLVYPRTR